MLLLLWIALIAGPAVAEEAAAGAAAAVGELQPYVNAQQQYRLSVPAGWDRKDKAGACNSIVHAHAVVHACSCILVPMHKPSWGDCCRLR
jgi:hypothetical protein